MLLPRYECSSYLTFVLLPWYNHHSWGVLMHRGLGFRVQGLGWDVGAVPF